MSISTIIVIIFFVLIIIRKVTSSKVEITEVPPIINDPKVFTQNKSSSKEKSKQKFSRSNIQNNTSELKTIKETQHFQQEEEAYIENPIEKSEAIGLNVEFSQEEAKKAIIYAEIMQRKY